MASAKQDYREATALVFMEVCFDSITKNSTYGDNELAIFNRIYRVLVQAWRPINARQIVDPVMLLKRHKRLALALQMVWGPAGTPVNGKTILCGLMELGERVWNTAGLAVCAFTGGQEPEKAKLHTNLPDLDAIASNPESYLVQDMGEGRTMEIFKTPGEEVWFRYTFPLRKENNPFGKKEEKVCERWLTSVPKVG